VTSISRLVKSCLPPPMTDIRTPETAPCGRRPEGERLARRDASGAKVCGLWVAAAPCTTPAALGLLRPPQQRGTSSVNSSGASFDMGAIGYCVGGRSSGRQQAAEQNSKAASTLHFTDSWVGDIIIPTSTSLLYCLVTKYHCTEIEKSIRLKI